MRKIIFLILSLSIVFSLAACGQTENPDTSSEQQTAGNAPEADDMQVPQNFVLIRGGSFQMGSPETEAQTDTVCLPRRNGNMPAVPARLHRFIWKIRRVPRTQTITGITLMK